MPPVRFGMMRGPAMPYRKRAFPAGVDMITYPIVRETTPDPRGMQLDDIPSKPDSGVLFAHYHHPVGPFGHRAPGKI